LKSIIFGIIKYIYIERNTTITILQICKNITSSGGRSILPICRRYPHKIRAEIVGFLGNIAGFRE